MSHGYSIPHLGKPATSHAEGFGTRKDACLAAGARFGLSAGEVAQLHAEGFLYLREPQSNELTSNCITVWENAS